MVPLRTQDFSPCAMELKALVEGVLYFGWPNQPSSGTIGILHWDVFLCSILREVRKTELTPVMVTTTLLRAILLKTQGLPDGVFIQPKFNIKNRALSLIQTSNLFESSAMFSW